MDSIHSIVKKAERNYLFNSVQMGRYVNWSMHDTIETIDAYLNSKHISGSTDSLNREKPFFNIVTAATNIWFRATDLDRKDIRVLPDTSSDVALAFVAYCLLQQWMREERFGVFLNDWGRALARYGSAVVKFVEKGGKLCPSVVPWNRFIADPIDFDAIPRIEKFYKTPEQLRDMPEYDQDQVSALIDEIANRKTLDGRNQDNQSGFIELYEVHGRLPSYLLDKDPKPVTGEDVTYSQQMHVISYVGEDDDCKDFTLFKGREAKDPYMITHLIKEDGRTLAIGSVEYLFDAQWMTNHTMKQWKDQLDLASKLIFQTADAQFAGRNVLSNIETGDILVRKANMPLEPINNAGHDTANMTSFLQEWNNAAQAVTSTPDALRGTTLPSGTPYALGALLANQGGSLFEIMTENKGLALEDMLREFVIPYLKKKMNHKEEIVAILDASGIKELDAMYVPSEAVRRFNKDAVQKTIKALESGDLSQAPQPFNPEQAQGQVKQELAPLGNKRIIKPDEIGEKTWKQALDGFEYRVVVDITNENKDKQAVLTTLSSTLQTVSGAAQQGRELSADERLILNKILLETSVVSPLELSTAAASPPPRIPPPPGQQPPAPVAA